MKAWLVTKEICLANLSGPFGWLAVCLLLLYKIFHNNFDM